MNTILFILLWPVMWFVLPLTRRVRVVIVRDGKVLLVKNAVAPNHWALPGGGIKRGESVAAAAKRECTEELGVEITSVKELHEEPVVFRQYGLLLRYHFVSAQLAKDAAVKRNWEISQTTWMNVVELTDVAEEVNRGLALTTNR